MSLFFAQKVLTAKKLAVWRRGCSVSTYSTAQSRRPTAVLTPDTLADPCSCQPVTCHDKRNGAIRWPGKTSSDRASTWRSSLPSWRRFASFVCAATRFGLTINVSKTEVLYQPTPGDLSQSVKIIIDVAEVKQTNKFFYLGSVLSDNAVIDDEIQCRTQKAASSFGLLQQRLWKRHGINITLKVKVYSAAVLTIPGESCS